VARGIREALAAGWNPSAKGQPFYLKASREAYHIPNLTW
jgi:hypothetical protein